MSFLIDNFKVVLPVEENNWELTPALLKMFCNIFSFFPLTLSGSEDIIESQLALELSNC